MVLAGTLWVKAEEEEAAQAEPGDAAIPTPLKTVLNHCREVMRTAAPNGAVVECDDHLSVEVER